MSCFLVLPSHLLKLKGGRLTGQPLSTVPLFAACSLQLAHGQAGGACIV